MKKQLFILLAVVVYIHICEINGQVVDTIGFIKKASNEPKTSHYGNRPRGVGLLKGPLYNTGNKFTCFDGSKTIDFAKVNDDYCDCVDGSDEPGTSACQKGVFHCINLGYKSEDIPSNRVNDQICDCCDGSDEWDSAIDCPNICERVGAQYREEEQRKAAVIRKGYEKRTHLAVEGGKLKEEKSKGIDDLRKERDDLVPLREKLESAKKELEEKEREVREKHNKEWEDIQKAKKQERAKPLFEKLDINGDGKITLEEIQKISEFDTDGNGDVTESEAKDYLAGNENVDFGQFVESLYDVVKLLFEKKQVKTEHVGEADKLDVKEAGETGKPEKLPSEVKEAVEAEGENASDGAENEEDKMPPFDEEANKLFAAVEQARKEFEEVNIKFRGLEERIREAEAFLNGDYGADDAWASLKGSCFEMDESQYVYRLCLFDKAIQKDRNSQMETSLGNWREWSGSDSNKYSEQWYDKGQQCWNGPERSTKVIIECGEETALVEATEPAKCEYRFVLTSPAACPDPSSLTEHEEL